MQETLHCRKGLIINFCEAPIIATIIVSLLPMKLFSRLLTEMYFESFQKVLRHGHNIASIFMLGLQCTSMRLRQTSSESDPCQR